MCRAHNANSNKRQNDCQLCPQIVSGLFSLPYQSRLLAHQRAHNIHKYLHPNLFYNGCPFWWQYTATPCSFLAGYPAASVTNTEHMMSCSSAAGLPSPSTFQLWHNLQFKSTAFVALMAKSQGMLWLGERQTLPCRFLAPPSRCLPWHFQEQTVNGLWVLCHPSCGGGSVHECSDIHWSAFLRQQGAELLSTCRWKVKSLTQRIQSKGAFTYALAATHSWAEDSSNHTLWMELLGKVVERD